MVQIHEALSNGMMPVIFLRFNPDNFKVGGKVQKLNMQKRLDVLSKWVSYCLNLKEELNTPSNICFMMTMKKQIQNLFNLTIIILQI